MVQELPKLAENSLIHVKIQVTYENSRQVFLATQSLKATSKQPRVW
jgi:hypothetical protein